MPTALRTSLLTLTILLSGLSARADFQFSELAMAMQKGSRGNHSWDPGNMNFVLNDVRYACLEPFGKSFKIYVVYSDEATITQRSRQFERHDDARTWMTAHDLNENAFYRPNAPEYYQITSVQPDPKDLEYLRFSFYSIDLSNLVPAGFFTYEKRSHNSIHGFLRVNSANPSESELRTAGTYYVRSRDVACFSAQDTVFMIAAGISTSRATAEKNELEKAKTTYTQLLSQQASRLTSAASEVERARIVLEVEEARLQISKYEQNLKREQEDETRFLAPLQREHIGSTPQQRQAMLTWSDSNGP